MSTKGRVSGSPFRPAADEQPGISSRRIRAALRFHALDHGSVSMAYSISDRMHINILQVIQSPALVAVDQVQGFDGFFGMFCANISRPRAWMPRLELIPTATMTEEARN